MLDSVNKLRILPVITFCWLSFTFAISYSIAVSLDHVYPVWPYISDTGTLPPESCYFGQMLNIGALLVGLVVYCRYKQVLLQLKDAGSGYRVPRVLNRVCLAMGIMMAFGMSMVANFQELSDIKIHILGASLAFFIGTGYFIVQTILCGMLNGGDPVGYKLNVLRTVLCIMLTLTYTTTIIFAKISLAEVKGPREAMHYNPSYPKYIDRLASTFSEWGLALCFGLYVVTFTYDFKHLKIKLTFSDSDLEHRQIPQEPPTQNGLA